jgi:lambda family phage portal protein
MGFIDKIIEFVSPTTALRREQVRYALEQVRGYDAGSRGKRAKGWTTTGGSADREIIGAGETIRARARDMVRNNPYANKSATVTRTGVVGPGVKISIRSKRATDNKKANALWKAWAETTACDFMGRKNFYVIQRLVINAIYVDGEVFIRQRRDASRAVPLQLQVLEADYLDTGKSHAQMSDGGRIDAGIETDRDGRVVAYWLWNQHPNDNTHWRSLTSDRVPADQILHIYTEDRPGQLRGVSKMASMLFALRDFSEYEDAQLIRQKIAACFSIFVTGEGEVRPGDPEFDGLPMERVEPGMIEYLAPGKGIQYGTPPTVENYDEYSRAILRGAAAGAGLTYEAFTGDLSNVNFSSGRMGWIEQSRSIKELQEDVIILQLCAPVWDWFVKAATVAGQLRVGAEIETSWTAPRREMIDPVKETKALNDLIRAGLTSWQDVVREMGGDPEILRAEIVADMALFDSIGAKPTIDPRYDPKRNDTTGAPTKAPPANKVNDGG